MPSLCYGFMLSYDIVHRFLYSMEVMLFTICMYRVGLFPGLHVYAYTYVPRPELAERNLLSRNHV
jgi:hypothetical protein